MSTKKKHLKRIGLFLFLVAVMFWFLLGFGIIPATGPTEVVTIFMLTMFLPVILGICFLTAGAAMKSE